MAFTQELLLQATKQDKLFEQMVLILETTFLLHAHLDSLSQRTLGVTSEPFNNNIRILNIPKSNRQIGSLGDWSSDLF